MRVLASFLGFVLFLLAVIAGIGFFSKEKEFVVTEDSTIAKSELGSELGFEANMAFNPNTYGKNEGKTTSNTEVRKRTVSTVDIPTYRKNEPVPYSTKSVLKPKSSKIEVETEVLEVNEQGLSFQDFKTRNEPWVEYWQDKATKVENGEKILSKFFDISWRNGEKYSWEVFNRLNYQINGYPIATTFDKKKPKPGQPGYEDGTAFDKEGRRIKLRPSIKNQVEALQAATRFE